MQEQTIDTSDRAYSPTVPAQLTGAPQAYAVESMLDTVIGKLRQEEHAAEEALESIEQALMAFEHARDAWCNLR